MSDELRKAALVVVNMWGTPASEPGNLSDAIEDLRAALASRALTLVHAQAEDEGLWFEATTATEAYLQAALRELHAAVESAGSGT